MFQRIANIFKGFLGLFVSGLEKRNPEALLELEKENLRKQITQFNQGLVARVGIRRPGPWPGYSCVTSPAWAAETSHVWLGHVPWPRWSRYVT